jgi:beta-lactamase regulating signal transducer with metallopeptidase domain
MDVLLRCVVLSLAAFGVAHVLASIAVASRVSTARESEPPAARADRLFRWQLLPTVVAAAVLVFAAVGLYRFESREGGEMLGRSLWIAGACGTAILMLMGARLIRMRWQTGRLLRAWLSNATPLSLPDVTLPAFAINTGFPIVAVIGIMRPRLVIDAQVLRACSEDELAAILAHERGHVRRWDNLRRAAFAAVPGPWFSTDLPQAWREATEEAADDLAAATGRDTRFHLANALLRVSRLAPRRTDASQWQTQLPASALYRGESIERRVRRLLETPATATPGPRPWTTAIVVGTLTMGFMLQRELHDVMEHVVAFLP